MSGLERAINAASTLFLRQGASSRGRVMRSLKPGSDPLDALDERTTDVDFAVMARALWARKIALILPVLVALIGSAVAVSLIPPEYKATASILLQPQETAFTRPIADPQQRDQTA